MERSRRAWGKYLLPTIAIGLFIAACTDSVRQPASPGANPPVPTYARTTPFNSAGSCLAADAFLGGTNGVNDSTTLANPNQNCTSNDVRIARAIIDSVSLDGGLTYQAFTGQAIPCTEGDPVFVSLAAQLKETATSARSDIGIWIARDGGNARTGSCNHYNLTNVGIPLDSTQGGVTNTDNDYCGDMNAGDSTVVGLGKLTLICQASPTSADSLHVGSCLGWTQPGGDQVCPVGLVETPQAFRNGTVPGTTSKCNCDGFNVPILVNQFALLEVRKVCVPTTDPGKFNLQIDGSTFGTGADASCGGTTGIDTVAAGTTANPGVSHSFGETAGTATSLSNYTSTRTCVNRTGGTVRLASAAGTGGSLTLLPDDNVICTITNTRNPGKLELVKALSPTNDPGKFNLFIRLTNGAGAIQDSATDVGNGGSTGAGGTSLPPNTYWVGEAAGTGTVIGNYTVTGPSCVLRGTATTVTVTAGALALGSNDDVVCTITNTRNTGKIELVKALNPTNDPGKFNLFIRNGTAGGSIADSATDVGNGGTTGAGGTTLNTGNYFVGEAAGTGTSLGDYGVTGPSCVLRGTATTVTVTAGVLALTTGADVVCTVTNVRNPGKLELIKALSPTNDPGKFNLFIRLTNGAGAIQDSATDVGNGGTTGAGGTSLPPNTYWVGELAGTGTTIGDYTVTGPSCVLRGTATTVTVTAGALALASNADVVCTITNTRNTGKIELIKSLSPTNDPGKFNLFIRNGTAGGSIADSATDVGNGGTTGAGGTTLNTGNYFVGEAAGTGTTAGNYTTTGPSCVLRGTATTVTVTAGVLALTNGADVVCTVTNVRNTGKIELIKSLSPTNDPGKFNLFIRNGTAGGSIADSATDVGNGGTTGAGGTTLNTGNYFVGEAAGTGTTAGDYTTTGPSCVLRGTATTVTVTAGVLALTNGADVVCTVTNVRNTGKIELIKATVPTNDVGKFNLFIRLTNGAGAIQDSATDVGNGGTTGAGGTTLNTGTYWVGEGAGTNTSLTNYVVTGPSCVLRGTATTVTVTAGALALTTGADVVCTITNSRKAVLIVDKIAPGVPDLFNFSQTGISNFQLADITAPKKTVDILPGNVTVCELGVFVAWSTTVTVNGGSVTPTVDGTTGDVCYIVALAYGDSTTIAFTNTPPPGGGTRTIGYWKNHSSCASSNGKQYEKAIAAGHPEATLDFYLTAGSEIYPIGDITSLTCAQAVNLLSKNAIDGGKRAGDPIYNMVAQLLGAKLNVAADAGTCATLLTALGEAQTFLDALNFTGLGSYKGTLSAADQTLVNGWAAIFGSYNEGTLGGGCPTHI